ncbi:Transducin (beta)-like 3 [Rhizoclosmatium hyalinum]|nr:Transducin (beta)-like 3 [Rhizoclosmatium hyalinum]
MLSSVCVRVYAAGSAGNTGASSTAGIGARGTTHRATVRDHTVTWNAALATTSTSSTSNSTATNNDNSHRDDPSTPLALITNTNTSHPAAAFEVVLTTDRDGVLSPCELVLVIKQELNAGRAVENVGSVTINLADFAAHQIPVERRYLLQESKVNATLKVTIAMKLTKGLMSDFKVPASASKIDKNVISMEAIRELFSAHDSNSNIEAKDADPRSPSTPKDDKSSSVSSSIALIGAQQVDLSFYDESEDIRINAIQTNSHFNHSSFKAVRSFAPIYTGGKTALINNAGGRPGSFVIASVDKDLNVLGVESGNVELAIVGEADEVTCFAVKPDGKHLVSATRSLLLNYIDLENGQVLRSWKAHEAPVLSMAFDMTSTLVATGSADSTIRVWDVDRGHATHLFKGHHGVISALTFYNGKKGNDILLASASDDCKVRVWDLSTKQCVWILDSHVSVVRGVSFSPDAAYLLTGGRDKILNVWDLETGELTKTIPTHESMESVGLIPEVSKRHLAKTLSIKNCSGIAYTAGEKGIIRLWDLESGDCIMTQPSDQNASHEISDVLVVEDKHQLVAVTTDHNFLFYDMTSELQRVHQIVGYNEEIVDVRFVSPDESLLAVASNSEQIKVMDLESSNCDILYGHSNVVVCLDRSKDGRLLASGSKDNSSLIWGFNEETRKFGLIGSCVGHTEAVGAVAFSSKANSFLVTGSSDRTIKVWDISKLEKQAKTAAEPIKLKSSYTFQAHEKDINSIAVAPNDRIFATGSQDKTAKVWSAVDGSLVGTCTGHKRGVWCVQFSTVDQVLVTSSGDKTIKLWSMSDYSCLKTLEGHLNSVLKVSFVSLGMQMVSSGSDGLVKLWNIKNNECVNTFDAHEDKVWALAMKQDESLVVSGGADSKITLWEDCTVAEQEENDRITNEKVTKEQDLLNFLKKKDYKNAIILALELDKPMRLLTLFRQLNKTRLHSNSVTGLFTVDEVIKDMEAGQLEQLLGYIKDWNTHSKHASIAQLLLNLIMSNKSSEQLLKTKKVKELLDSLIVYSERHYGHVDEMLRKSYLISYTLDRMDDMLGGAGELELA